MQKPIDIMADLDLDDASLVADLLHRTAELNRSDPRRNACVIDLPKQGKLLATGDLHDNTPALQRVVKQAKLDQSPEHHLVLHELIHGPTRLNGMDLSIRTLARACAIKCAFPEQVCFLLSNHELAQRRQEHVFKDGGSDIDAFNEGLDHLYDDAASTVHKAFDDYVDSLPLAIRCGNGVMVAHSLPAPRKIEVFDTTVLERELTDADYESTGSATFMVWGRHQNQKIAQELADAWNVDAFILGHQQAEMGWEEKAHNILILASDHGHGMCLPIDLSQTYTRDDLIEHLVHINGITL
ncbi:MAG: metallophosphoesterase [Phycisphaeraceae bacterium]